MRFSRIALAAALMLGSAAVLPAIADDTTAPAQATTAAPAATPANAAAPATAATPAAAPATATAAKEDPVVCKSQPITGSRLGVQRICAKQSEWDRRTREDRTHMENIERGGFTSGG